MKNSNNRKGNNLMSGFMSIIGLILKVAAIVGIVIGGIAAAVRFFAKRPPEEKKDTEKKDTNKNVRDGTPDETEIRKKMAKEYCGVLRDIAVAESKDVYKKNFADLGNLYQQLLGAERRYGKKDMKDKEFISFIGAAMSNFSMENKLSEKGFDLSPEVKTVDEEAVTKRFLEMSMSDLKNITASKKRELAGYTDTVDYEKIAEAAGKKLYKLLAGIRSGNSEECARLIREIGDDLKKYGCCCLYYDSPEINTEALKVDFAETGPSSTELPGLYITAGTGRYKLIGGCCGTRRKSQ